MPRIIGDSEIERLVARSRALGGDATLVVHGGGNTSTKLEERDHRDRVRAVLRIKGSGTDLATISADGFPGLFLDDLLAVRDRAAMPDEEMVAYLAHCMLDPAAPRPSIETLLHAFLPARHVDHSHADAICALTNHPDGRIAVRDALGGDVAVVDYLRPGFELAKRTAAHADASAVVLEHHGLVTWGDSHEASLDATLHLAGQASAYLTACRQASKPATATTLPERDAARLLVELRDALASDAPRVLHVDRDHGRRLADRADVDAVARGRSTPDHMLRIGWQSAVVRSAADVAGVVDGFAAANRAFIARHAERLPAGVPPLSLLPRVVLVPGLGIVAAGGDARTARVNAEIAYRSHLVTATVLDVFGRVAWLDEDEIFDFAYWPMELYKLTLAPAPRALAGRIVAVAGLPAPAAALLRERGAVIIDADESDPAGTARAAVARYGGLDAVVSADAATAEAVAAGAAALLGHHPLDVVLTASAAADPPRGLRGRAGNGAPPYLVRGGEAAAVGEAVAFILARRAPLRHGAELVLDDGAAADG